MAVGGGGVALGHSCVGEGEGVAVGRGITVGRGVIVAGMMGRGVGGLDSGWAARVQAMASIRAATVTVILLRRPRCITLPIVYIYRVPRPSLTQRGQLFLGMGIVLV